MSIVIEGLEKTYGDVRALRGVMLNLAPGGIVGLLGPNGAGKTTLVGLISGRLRATAGTVRFAGRDVTRLRAWERAGLGIVYTFQVTSVYKNLTVHDNVALAAQRSRLRTSRDWITLDQAAVTADVEAALARVGLAGRGRERAGALAYGHQRVLEVAMALALGVAGFQVADADGGAGGNRRGQRGREDEARRVGADGVAQVAPAGDVAAHDAEALGQGAVDDVDAVHHPVALGDAAAARAVETDRVHLVEVGERAVFFGEIADGADRGHQPVHGIAGLEGDHLGPVAVDQLQLGFEVGQVVVAPDHLLAAAVADAGDHGGVVLGVGEDDEAGEQLAQRRQRGVVGHVGGGEEERGLLVVQIGELGLQLHVIVRGARDVPGAARAGASRRRTRSRYSSGERRVTMGGGGPHASRASGMRSTTNNCDAGQWLAWATSSPKKPIESFHFPL